MSEVVGNKTSGGSTTWESQSQYRFLVYPNSYLASTGERIRKIGLRRSGSRGGYRIFGLYRNDSDSIIGSDLAHNDGVFEDEYEDVGANHSRYEYNTNIALDPGYFWLGYRTERGYINADNSAENLLSVPIGEREDPVPLTIDSAEPVNKGDLWFEVIHIEETAIATIGTVDTSSRSILSLVDSAYQQVGAEIEYRRFTDEKCGEVLVKDTGHWAIDRAGTQTMTFRIREGSGAEWTKWFTVTIKDLTEQANPALRSVDPRVRTLT